MSVMFVTFEPFTKVSRWSHDHATIRFANGTLSVLSRDRVKSVSDRWVAIGTYTSQDGKRSAHFVSQNDTLRMVGCQLRRMGWDVTGIKWDESSFGVITATKGDGRITDPESQKGRIRVRSLNRANMVAKGERGVKAFRPKGLRHARPEASQLRVAIRAKQTERCYAHFVVNGNHHYTCVGCDAN